MKNKLISAGAAIVAFALFGWLSIAFFISQLENHDTRLIMNVITGGVGAIIAKVVYYVVYDYMERR